MMYYDVGQSLVKKQFIKYKQWIDTTQSHESTYK